MKDLKFLLFIVLLLCLGGCSSIFGDDSDSSDTSSGPASTGETFNFYEASGEKRVLATCRKVVSGITTNQGSKTLNIWVANDCWTSGGTKSKLITQMMVDAMADKFLKSGLDNDIYDWVTNICGAEWGTHNYSNLISSSQSINILLCDIGDDNYTTGGVLGYFWSGNNATTSSVANSNQRVMFCIDALIYANGGSTWSSTAELPRIIFSTLAHEFQHMIFYYQQNVRKNISHDTWFNEMLSMSIEDLVAYKMFGDYLSSPYYERFSELNACNYYSLCKWADGLSALPYYAMNYGFGSYLLRHYDGANFVKNVYASGIVTGSGQYETNNTSGTLDVNVSLTGTGAVLIDNQSHPSINLTLSFTTAKTLYFIFTNSTGSQVSSYSVSSDNVTFSTSVGSSSILSSSIDNGKVLFKDAVLPDVPDLPGCLSVKSSIFSSTIGNSNAVESVTGKSFSTLQRNWGAAYLLSDQTGLSGDFAYNDDVSSTVNSSTYNLVLINAFKQKTPQIYTIGNKKTVNARGNVYYKVADNFTSGTFAISLGANLKLTVVAK